MDKLSIKEFIITFLTTVSIIIGCLFLFGTLVPWYAETFGEEEKEEISIESDIKTCGKYYPHRIGSTLYCRCNGKVSRLPGKCEDKYK